MRKGEEVEEDHLGMANRHLLSQCKYTYDQFNLAHLVQPLGLLKDSTLKMFKNTHTHTILQITENN